MVTLKKLELYLQETTELDKWHSTAQEASKSLINTSVIEANYKATLMVHSTGKDGQLSLLCFQGCGHKGTMYHILWQCPKVRCFWIRVYNFIYTLTQVNLGKSQRQALLGCRVESASIPQRRLNAFIFILAKIIIAKCWKLAVLPFEQLKHKHSWIMINEHMSAILKDKMRMFEKVWDPWVKYLTRDPRFIPDTGSFRMVGLGVWGHTLLSILTFPLSSFSLLCLCYFISWVFSPTTSKPRKATTNCSEDQLLGDEGCSFLFLEV